MLCSGLLPYAFLGFVGAYIGNDYVLMLDRFLLGGATVAVQVSVTSFIADFFTGERRMKLIAWQGMAIELGGVIFLSIGGMLGEYHWQYPFYIYLIALICFLLVLKTLPCHPNGKVGADGGADLKTDDNRRVRLVFYGAVLAMVLFFVGFVTLPLYLPSAFGFSESVTGYYMAFISVVAILTASQMPKVVVKMGDGNTIAMGFVFFLLGYACLAVSGNLVFLVLTTVFVGTGFGFTVPLLNHMMIEASSNKNLGKNLGLYSMGIFGGQFLSTFIDYVSDDYAMIYGFAAVLAFFIATGMFLAFKGS